MKNRLFVEILTPKQGDAHFDESLERFAERYQTILDDGYVVSVPDNPMGNLHFQMTEVLTEFQLPVNPEQLLLHVNTFHRKEDLDTILRTARDLGIRNLLVISGDGGERLPKLKPEALGMTGNAVTSVELLLYIAREHGDAFECGVAFNQYEPEHHEIEKLSRKLNAGARFAITQPTLNGDRRVEVLDDCQVPTAYGAWMSKNLPLLSDCIGYPLPAIENYDPVENLKEIRRRFPNAGLYLALVNFKTQLKRLRELLD